jgi:acetylornithine deacetylase/succinyl-diaminopimelate desuccinylase-like protein
MQQDKLDQISKFIAHKWQESITPELIEYIKIPCKSPDFDEKWEENKYLDKAITQFKNWVIKQDIKNILIDVITLPNRTPLLFLEIAASNTNCDETILLYGHLDKQPEMTGWADKKGPWQPVIEENKLYGRGGADDGYALFASITAIAALQKNNLSHPRCVIIIEACEESGSYDLPYYIDHLKNKIKTPSLVICLDSGCGNYEQFWLTTSLRGNIKGILSVELINEGVHSGSASGIVPSSFRVIRQLLSRLEDEQTGEILIESLSCPIPPDRVREAEQTADILHQTVYIEFPFHQNVLPVQKNIVELLLNRTWRPQLAITGADGLPKPADAGNVMRPKTSLVLSMRLPPNVNADNAMLSIKQTLESNPPYNAKVSFASHDKASGWNSPKIAPWLQEAINKASLSVFGKPAAYWGEGGTIPFMSMLGEKFPEAQFVITGVLGPKSNAHGPNEFLHLEMAEKLTTTIACIINDFATLNI